MKPRLRKLILLAPAMIVGLLLLLAIGGTLVQQLWNWLLPALAGWPRITFWQALGLLLLCRILFGGCGWHGRGRSAIHRGREQPDSDMTPEEWERLRQRVRERFGGGLSEG